MNESIEEITQKKRVLRKTIRARVNALSSDQLRNKSESIAEKLFLTAWWQEASWIFGYITMFGEVETKEIIGKAYKDLKKVAIPRIEGESLAFYGYQGGIKDLLLNKFGILEPDPIWQHVEPSKLISQTLLIITPGLCFDRLKQRLGRGKGFYDRFLKMIRGEPAIHAKAVGLSFSEQLVPIIPVSIYDQPVDGVITDQEIIE